MGLRKFAVSKLGDVTSKAIQMPSSADAFFNQHVILVFTNIARASSKVLSKFSVDLAKGNASTVSKSLVPDFDEYVKSLLALDQKDWARAPRLLDG